MRPYSSPLPPQLPSPAQAQFAYEQPLPIEYELRQVRYSIISTGGMLLAMWFRWNTYTDYIYSVSLWAALILALLVALAGCGLYIGLRILVPQLLGYRVCFIIHPAHTFEWRFSRPIASPTHYLICLLAPGLCVTLLAISGIWLTSSPWLTFASIILLPFAVLYESMDVQRGLRLLKILPRIKQQPMPRILWYWRDHTPKPQYGTII